MTYPWLTNKNNKIVIFSYVKAFFANTDQSSIAVQKPIHVMFARFLRIIVDQFNSNPVLRLEFIGILVGKSFYNHFFRNW